MNIKNIVKRIINELRIFRLRYSGVKVGDGVYVNGDILLSGTKNICIADDVYINSNEKSNPIGGNVRCYFKTFNGGGIYIGKGCRISNLAVVSVSSVTIGENVYLGGSCCIYDTDFHSLNFVERVKGGGDKDIVSLPVTIGCGCFIGAHSIILKGVTIGEYSIVGAGSIVTKNIPSGEIWAGNPAKFIRKVE